MHDKVMGHVIFCYILEHLYIYIQLIIPHQHAFNLGSHARLNLSFQNTMTLYKTEHYSYNNKINFEELKKVNLCFKNIFITGSYSYSLQHDQVYRDGLFDP